MKVALTVPESPSVTVTSFTESDASGSLSMIVPRPLASAIVAFSGVREAERERLVGLVEEVAVDGHRDRLRRLPAAKASVPAAAV